MNSDKEIRNMVLSFRWSELMTLLSHINKRRSGRKADVQKRILSVLQKDSSDVQRNQLIAKIKEIYREKYQRHDNRFIFVPCSWNNYTPSSSPSCIPSNSSAPPNSLVTSSCSVPNTCPYPSLSVPPQEVSMLPSYHHMYNNSCFDYPPQLYPKLHMDTAQPAAVHPDVKIKRLPFFNILAELIRPSSLAGSLRTNLMTPCNESNFVFYLSPHQTTDISSSFDINKNEYQVQVQLRFCLQETTCEQEDYFPPGISVKVNNKFATLPNVIPSSRPGVEPRRPSRPIDITTLVRLSPYVPNDVCVSWNIDYSRGYVLVLHLVKKLGAEDLLDTLKKRGVKNGNFTQALIKEKLCVNDTDVEIASSSLKVSLLCPLGKMKMLLPARSTLCSHLQCFDASLFLQMNERRPTWNCPVCNQKIPFDTIVIDGYFQDILNSPNIGSEKDVQLNNDGSWSCLPEVNKEVPVKNEVIKPEKEDVQVVLDDTEDDISIIEVKNKSATEVVPAKSEKQDKSKKKVIEIDLTYSDSEPEVEAISVSSNSTGQRADVSDNSNSSEGVKSATHSNNPFTYSLGTPSPPDSPFSSINPDLLNPLLTISPNNQTSSSHLLTHSSNSSNSLIYPQVIKGPDDNADGSLVLSIRLPPRTDDSRYRPY